MPDNLEVAQRFEAQNLEQSLRAQQERARATVRPKAAGHCLNPECLEPFPNAPNRLFCGPSCAESFEAVTQHNPAM